MSSDPRRITASDIAVKLSSQKFHVQMNRCNTVETQKIFKEHYLRDYIIINCKHEIGLLVSCGATCELLRIAWNQMSPKSADRVGLERFNHHQNQMCHLQMCQSHCWNAPLAVCHDSFWNNGGVVVPNRLNSGRLCYSFSVWHILCTIYMALFLPQ